MPPQDLIDALDDDGDGREDAGCFDGIVANACQEVDGYLCGLFTVPFVDPIPAKVSQAALFFALDAIYARRSNGNEDRHPNPFRTQAKFWREHLQKVGNRELPLDASKEKAFTPGAAIVEPTGIDAQMT